jgi:hypothetical protein
MAGVLLAGCRRQEDVAQLKAINQSLENANSIIQDGNLLLKEDLLLKKYDLRYNSDGVIWEPRANQVATGADSIVVLINKLKQELLKQSDSLKKEKAPIIEQLSTPNGPGSKLVGRLAAFKDSILTIIRVHDVDNPVKKANLFTNAPLLPGYADSLNEAQRKQYATKWLEENFSGSSALMTLIVLNKIENELLVTTKAFMEYCISRSAIHTCGWPYRVTPVAILSSSYVKPGQPIEVTAGIGGFGPALGSRILIGGKEIALNNDGAVVHRFAAKGKPGEYKIRVEFEFTKPDGSTEHVYKDLNYIIADEK